ncbi:unnamed protein product [Lactuca virosa]|uniref:Uncharacterized protein n=1 Tax=Lactuca virosa TaxID=75947 RepID=A0AAU9M4T5_9ASTR|nr:unnamed protein product [Lactuca virosa]
MPIPTASCWTIRIRRYVRRRNFIFHTLWLQKLGFKCLTTRFKMDQGEDIPQQPQYFLRLQEEQMIGRVLKIFFHSFWFIKLLEFLKVPSNFSTEVLA